MVVRPKHMVLGRSTWSALRTNPSVLRSLTVSGAGDGMANLRAVADLLELDDIYVGDSWVNSAKPGQPVQRIRAWGGHACLFHKAPMANSVRPNPTFSYTVQFGERVSGSIPEPKIGLRGSDRVRSGESVKEVFPTFELGYLFSDAA